MIDLMGLGNPKVDASGLLTSKDFFLFGHLEDLSRLLSKTCIVIPYDVAIVLTVF